MVTNDVVQYTSGFSPYILLFTQAPNLIWFYRTNIDIISTILLTMYYSVLFMFCYDWCWPCMMINISVEYNDGFLPDIILLTQGYYHWGTRLNTM